VARDVAHLLDGQGKGDLTQARVAARLRPSVVSIHANTKFTDSTGTGVIIDKAGHILTNLHVVENLSDISVSLSSGDLFTAILLGSDEATDLALLKIKPDAALYPVTFADSEDLVVGQRVLAMGNAFGFGWSVTGGLISSLHRSDFQDRDYTNYIQTDAAINPGNSGGPLVDARGHVIGINSVIVSKSGGSAGIGFALPASDARFVAEELIKRGKVDRGFLGVRGTGLGHLERKDRRKLGADTTRGVLLTYVAPRSPAAGVLEPGDIIIEMDGSLVATYSALRSAIARARPGTTVQFRILRDGDPLRRTVTLADWPVGS